MLQQQISKNTGWAVNILCASTYKRVFLLMQQWGHEQLTQRSVQVSTLLPWCFTNEPTMPLEGSTVNSGISETPLSVLSWHATSGLSGSLASSSKATGYLSLLPPTWLWWLSTGSGLWFPSLWAIWWSMLPQNLCIPPPQSGLQHSSHNIVSRQLTQHNVGVFAHDQGTVSLMIKTFLREGDQSVRSGLRVVVAISGRNTTCQPMSTNIFHSLASRSWSRSAGVEPLLTTLVPFQTKVTARRGLYDPGGK